MRCQGLVICTALLLAGCSRKPASFRPDLAESHQAVVANSNALTWKAYAKLRTAPGNLVLSPYGVSVSLCMLLSGSDGATRDELLAVLGSTARHESELHAAQGELLRWLTDDDGSPGDQLDAASAVFLQRDTDVLKAFLISLETNYDAKPHIVDFINQPATARKVINDWAREMTHGKAGNIAAPDDITSDTRLMMASAVYFKGEWEHAFERSRTDKEPFHVSADQTVDCEMMHQTETFGYAHPDGLRVLVMPYRGGELSMVVLLPDKTDGLSAVEERLDNQALIGWIAAAENEPVRLPVWLPRFKFENGHDLEAMLKELGVRTAFDPAAADLSRIDGLRPTSASPRGRLYLDRIWQQAMIDVNEEGTEAAAVTVTNAKTTAKEPHDAPLFRADHPFLFLIRQNETGLVLFLGRLVNPTAP